MEPIKSACCIVGKNIPGMGRVVKYLANSEDRKAECQEEQAQSLTRGNRIEGSEQGRNRSGCEGDSSSEKEIRDRVGCLFQLGSLFDKKGYAAVFIIFYPRYGLMESSFRV